tara:strand:- start:479 stop:1564 length:1086 start_codon:yes stop_codon:yes gene_type:complete
MNLYRQYIINPVRDGIKNPNKGIPIPLKGLSKYTNYIEKGQYTAIGGKPTSGKTSLMDQIYMINVYKWWSELGTTDEEGNFTVDENRPNLKMFYFSMKKKPVIKWQKWICLYLKMEHNLVIDIPTLTGQVGRLYDLTQEHIDQIKAAEEFFTNLENDVLVMISGPQQPSSIYNRIKDYMLEIGRMDQEDNFILDKKHSDTYVFGYVDDTSYLLPETDGFQNMNAEGLKRKIDELSLELSRDYKVNMNIISPSKSTYSTKVKDSEPTYKELGCFATSVDLGLVAYNPYVENNSNYLGYPVDDTVTKGKTRLRTITVVRNPLGLESVTIPCFFLGECGYFAEAPHPTETEEYTKKIAGLNKLP